MSSRQTCIPDSVAVVDAAVVVVDNSDIAADCIAPAAAAAAAVNNSDIAAGCMVPAAVAVVAVDVDIVAVAAEIVVAIVVAVFFEIAVDLASANVDCAPADNVVSDGAFADSNAEAGRRSYFGYIDYVKACAAEYAAVVMIVAVIPKLWSCLGYDFAGHCFGEDLMVLLEHCMMSQTRVNPHRAQIFDETLRNLTNGLALAVAATTAISPQEAQAHSPYH